MHNAKFIIKRLQAIMHHELCIEKKIRSKVLGVLPVPRERSCHPYPTQQFLSNPLSYFAANLWLKAELKKVLEIALLH